MTGRGARARTVSLAAGCVVLTACSKNAPSALDAEGPAARSIASVWWLMFGLATVVYLAVAGLIVVAAMRGRRRGDDEGKPSRVSDNAFIVIGGLVVPVVILGVLAVVTVRTTDALTRPDRNALRVEVEGFQWWWAVRYPEQDVTTANEIRIPVGRPVVLELITDDVIHSFWVPQLAGKMDMVPGQRNLLHVEADRAGVYRGQCAEYCGVQHAKMAFLVVAEPQADFQRWIERQRRPRGGPTTERQALGEVVFTRTACAGCHTIRGTAAAGTIGPDLSDVGSRRTIGAVAIPNTPEAMADFIADSQAVKPGNLMPPIELPPEELSAVVEYLESQR